MELIHIKAKDGTDIILNPASIGYILPVANLQKGKGVDIYFTSNLEAVFFDLDFAEVLEKLVGF